MKYSVSVILFCFFLMRPCIVFSEDPVVISADIQFRLAEQMMEKKDYTAAANEFIRFTYLFPHHPDVQKALYNAGLSYFHAGQFSEAKKQLEKIIFPYRDDGYASEAIFQLSEIYVRENNVEQAQTDHPDRGQGRPRSGMVHFRMALAG